jgi:methanogenic corrinoid protein MtbC1
MTLKQNKYRILLIYPPSNTQIHTSCPMGMLMIAAILENAGYEVHILDANATKKRRNMEDIVQIAQQLKPDIIGITLLTHFAREAYILASHLKVHQSKTDSWWTTCNTST